MAVLHRFVKLRAAAAETKRSAAARVYAAKRSEAATRLQAAVRRWLAPRSALRERAARLLQVAYTARWGEEWERSALGLRACACRFKAQRRWWHKMAGEDCACVVPREVPVPRPCAAKSCARGECIADTSASSSENAESHFVWVDEEF